jgi:hypothetical protein
MRLQAIQRGLPAILGLCCVAQAHDIITTPITWDREISRIVYARCASCHHDGGMAFSLMTYADARPWAEAIKQETLARRMPPWGAVKGFGDFRNDQALTPEQLELIVSWTGGGVPEGEAKQLLPAPKFDSDPTDAAPQPPPAGSIVASGDMKLGHAFKLDGLWPEAVPAKASIQITATLPDGSVEPLLWLKDYQLQYGHEFLLRTPLDLPAGTLIQGVPPGARVVLLAPAPSNPIRKGPAAGILGPPAHGAHQAP